MTRVVIVNGPPRAGKDTFIAMLTEALQHCRVPVGAFSSIDPVRNMLIRAGLDVEAKTEADRLLLATVGDAVERHSNWRTMKCVEAIYAFRAQHSRQGVFFLHVREATVIKTIRETCRMTVDGVGFSTVLLNSPRAEQVTSNAADAGVFDMVYDHVVFNNGSLERLRSTADDFAKLIMESEL